MHSVVENWFAKRFGSPTPIQQRAWEAIATGSDVLISAPTGSGKTLAAFLCCLSQLVERNIEKKLTDRISVLYISPLKALSNDIQRNLTKPLQELSSVAQQEGLGQLDIRASVRTGDTSEKDRREIAKKPPHILVTTPESAYILLTSESGRRALAQVGTVIVDEIHATIADKRGAHLALTLERIEHLVVQSGASRPQRIGLSATMQPMDMVARWLVGSDRAMPRIVMDSYARDLELYIEVPKDELGAVCTHEQRDELCDRIAELSKTVRTMIVFVNTRRFVERFAYKLAERLGEDQVAAHHGSLSLARRTQTEQRLKEGTVRVVVATASLELGIDVGTIDLVCLVGSPRSIGTALQRIGRSGHHLGATPVGRFFPLTRDQLIECAAIVRCVRKRIMDRIVMRTNCLDILAQQMVALCASEEWDEDALFHLVRQAAPYAKLERHVFDEIIRVLADGISERLGRRGALLHRDTVHHKLHARRGARIAAITGGGAIPDNANYDVVLADDGTRVGSVDEDFAVESMAGEVFLLGSSSWRIRRIELGKVWVEDAQGDLPTIPFWFGEAPARTRELSHEVGQLREDIEQILFESGDAVSNKEQAIQLLMRECALDRRGADLACDYIQAARAVLGAVPTQKTVIAERFFDESGGMQLIIHAPFGGRINRAWGTSLRKRFCRQFDFELQAAATDEGLLLSLGPQHSFPLETMFELVTSDAVTELLTQASIQSPMFRTRWRWNLVRSLMLLRFQGGKRVPPPWLRMRADDLLSAVFPEQQGCQDNHGLDAQIEPPDHPIVNETVRDCLVEPMDAEGLRDVLEKIKRGEIACHCRDTPEPSVLSHEILNANPYAFLDDAPLEERRARAVQVRRGLPAQMVERVGALDQVAINEVIEEAAPMVRNEHELYDVLTDLIAVPEEECIRAGWRHWFDKLVADGRASIVTIINRKEPFRIWTSIDSLNTVVAAWNGSIQCALPSISSNELPEDARVKIIRSRLSISGPTTVEKLASCLQFNEDDVNIALHALESNGIVLRGTFSSQLEGLQWCDRRLLARIHRKTVDGLRKSIEPVTVNDFMRFLFAWQSVRPANRLRGRQGLWQIIQQLQGLELAASAWEPDVLSSRIADYSPFFLDELCLSGKLLWGRFAKTNVVGSPSKAAPMTLVLRADAPMLLRQEPAEEAQLSHPAKDVLAFLKTRGASFLDEIVLGSKRLRSEVEDGLWELVASGYVTSDSFAGLRALITPLSKRSQRIVPGRRFRSTPFVVSGRWSLLDASFAHEQEINEGERVAWFARQYLRRYGVVFRDVLERETHTFAWRDLLREYRIMEMRGEIRGGRMIAGFVGEQFAIPEALESLRAVRKMPTQGETICISACDPLNLTGLITPGTRIPSVATQWVVYRDGVFVDATNIRMKQVAKGDVSTSSISSVP